MEHKQFGHLQVQDLFQKGYYTNVYRAFDPSKNKGVLLQIITPIFSANNRYNKLLAKFTKGLQDLTNGSFLSITQHINYADRIGLVYDLPHGSAEEWETFTYSDFTASPDLGKFVDYKSYSYSSEADEVYLLKEMNGWCLLKIKRNNIICWTMTSYFVESDLEEEYGC